MFKMTTLYWKVLMFSSIPFKNMRVRLFETHSPVLTLLSYSLPVRKQLKFAAECAQEIGWSQGIQSCHNYLGNRLANLHV